MSLTARAWEGALLHHRSKQEPAPIADHSDLSASVESEINLLIVDCETRRFAVAGPIERSISRRWIGEIERAERSGRRIFCVPVANIQRSEIATLVAVLGYQEWPPTTIVSPPAEIVPEAETPEEQFVPDHNSGGRSHELRERELSAISRNKKSQSKSAKSGSSNI
jgi:hypothetical protein